MLAYDDFYVCNFTANKLNSELAFRVLKFGVRNIHVTEKQGLLYFTLSLIDDCVTGFMKKGFSKIKAAERKAWD